MEAGRLRMAELKTSGGSSSGRNSDSSSDSSSSSSGSNSSSLRDWLLRTLRNASQDRYHRDLDSCCGGRPLAGHPS